ncbi:hypothetical protein EON64_20660 [archaeon]|nr:MAG: hypothetical protein EON64_20660 [archaeon]
MMASEPMVRIVYGSETGTAEDVAFGLFGTLQEQQIPCSICSASGYSLSKLLEDCYIVFVVSTTGEGEFPSSTRGLWSQLLRRDLPATCLSQLQYAIFGLGDSAYTLFNAAARYWDVLICICACIHNYTVCCLYA